MYQPEILSDFVYQIVRLPFQHIGTQYDTSTYTGKYKHSHAYMNVQMYSHATPPPNTFTHFMGKL